MDSKALLTHQSVRISTEAGLFIGVLGGVLWLTGRPFIFPSLGPTAFILAFPSREHRAREVIGGHLCGLIAGLIAYHLLAGGLVLTEMPSKWTWDALRLAGSGALSVMLTAGGMLLTQTVHAPACATTLIVSLGLLSTLLDGAIILISVAMLQGLYWGIHVAWPERR